MMTKQYDDPYLRAARSRAAEIDRDLATIDQGLVSANNDGDEYAMREMVSGRATLRAERRALEHDYNEHVRLCTTPQRQPSNKKLQDMDMLENCAPENRIPTINYLVGQSKYFDPTRDWADPEVQRRVREGEAAYEDNKRSKEYNGS
jgi:hypothetical protein